MSSTPAVTVAIPFHNAGRYFALALQSVFAQTFSDWELLLIDDGSTDGSLELAQSLKDPRVRVHSDGQNLRLARRLNQAAQMARGRYLFRMDADDIMHPARIETQLHVLESAHDNTVLGTAVYSIGAQSEVVGFRPAQPHPGVGFAARHSFVHPSVAAPTQWFLSNPYSEEPVFSRSEDAELWCRTSATSDFRWLKQPLCFYREMGVFNLKNYLGGARGVLELIQRFVPSPFSRLQWTLKERAKMVVATLLDASGASDVLIKGRFVKISPAKRDAGNLIVQEIARVKLPGIDRS